MPRLYSLSELPSRTSPLAAQFMCSKLVGSAHFGIHSVLKATALLDSTCSPVHLQPTEHCFVLFYRIDTRRTTTTHGPPFCIVPPHRHSKNPSSRNVGLFNRYPYACLKTNPFFSLCFHCSFHPRVKRYVWITYCFYYTKCPKEFSDRSERVPSRSLTIRTQPRPTLRPGGTDGYYIR